MKAIRHIKAILPKTFASNAVIPSFGRSYCGPDESNYSQTGFKKKALTELSRSVGLPSRMSTGSNNEVYRRDTKARALYAKPADGGDDDNDHDLIDEDRKEAELLNSLKYLGDALKYFLDYYTYSQRQLAEEIGITEQHLSGIINNKKDLNLRLFRKITTILQIPPYLFFLKASMYADDKSKETIEQFKKLEPLLLSILDQVRNRLKT